MITKIALVIYFLTAFLGTSSSHSQDRSGNNINEVRVNSNKITFVFEANIDGYLKWYNNNVNTGSLEYQWTANFNLGRESYNAGFSIFKHPGAQQKTGTMEELINDGQISIFKNQLINVEGVSQEIIALTGMKTLLRGLKIRSELIENALVVEILEKDLVNKFIQNKPDSVLFINKTPNTGFDTFSVKVHYQ